MSECKYCALTPDESNILVSSAHWGAFLSLDQGYLGRHVIAPWQHRSSLGELTVEEAGDLIVKVIRPLELAISRAFGAVMFNHTNMMNNSFRDDANRDPHVHLHVRPRYDRPVVIGGFTFVDGAFGAHYDREHKMYPPPYQMAHILGRIRRELP